MLRCWSKMHQARLSSISSCPGFGASRANHTLQLKRQWAEHIAPLMDIEHNQSPSFGKLRDGLRRLVQGQDT